MMYCPQLIEHETIMSDKSEEEKKESEYVSYLILNAGIKEFKKNKSLRVLLNYLTFLSDYNRPFMDQVIARPIEKLPYFLTRQSD